MRQLTHVGRGNAKLWLLAAVLAVSMLAVTQDRTPASADTTEIGPSVSGTCGSPPNTWTCAPGWVDNVYLVKGGHTGTLNPCPESDPATSCIYVWAKSVDATTTGVSAFQVDVTYDSTLIHVTAFDGSTAWLNRTGRAASCPIHTIDNPTTGAGHAIASCNTLGSVPPQGPKCPTFCNGLLATLQFESVSPVPSGAITLNFSSSFMVDSPFNPDSAIHLPATLHSMTARIVKCANVSPDPANQVLITDIVYIINKYRSHGADFPTAGTPASPNWDPNADLDSSNDIRITDVTIAIAQYRWSCLL